MDFFGKTCPVCSRTFHEDDDIVVCPRCGAPYHRECYEEKGRCIFVDLHRKGESWQEAQDEKAKEEPAGSGSGLPKCPHCGAENPRNAIVCKKCGGFISSAFDGTPSPGSPADPGTPPEGTEPGTNPFPGGSPFAVFLDPMGGVSPEEDFDGVSGAEVSKYVKNNTSYYLPVFAKIKKEKKAKFNFCAFFFTGAWYLYRKQYVKGALIALFHLMIELSVMLVTSFFSIPLVREANDYFSNGMTLNGSSASVSIIDYITWAFNNKGFGSVVLILLPYMLYGALLVVRVICGFRGNKSYYRNAVKRIKAVKSKTHDGDTQKAIAEAGGVNNAVAWMCLVCYLILSFASLFIK